MKAQRIDGKAISDQIKEEAALEAKELQRQGITPCLAVVLVGNDPASMVYVNNKKKACEKVGYPLPFLRTAGGYGRKRFAGTGGTAEYGQQRPWGVGTVAFASPD